MGIKGTIGRCLHPGKPEVKGWDRVKRLNPYAVRWSKFAGGERMPFLVKTATGLPLQAPTYWVMSKRRPAGIQPNTLHNDLRALMYLYLWADARGADLQDRFETGALLTLTEVVDLDTFCGKYIQEAITDLPDQAGGVIRLDVRKSKPPRRQPRRKAQPADGHSLVH